MKHDPNLFEAFKDVSARQTEESQAPKASKAPGSIGSLGGSSSRAPGSGPDPRAALVVVALMLGSFGAGWFLRGPGEAVQAKGPADEGAGGERVVQPGSGGGSWLDGGGSEDWAPTSGTGNSGSGEVSAATGLYNPANEYTVLAITYADLPSLEIRALSTAQYLRDHGLPAFDPIKNGDKIEVLVGAAPTRSELQTVMSKLQGTRGPSGTSFDFRSALPVRIDSRVER